MNRRRAVVKWTAIGLAALLVASGCFVGYRRLCGPRTITAYFPTATAIYTGDQVRVAGVAVGTISAIEPLGTKTKMILKVDRRVRIPADVKAVIVAQSLIAARYVQLTPPYFDTGPVLADGAEIPEDRTAVPVEWDEVKTQLTRLAAALGPGGEGGVSAGSMGTFINSAANALGDGNGQKLRETIRQLSGAAKILADGSGDISGTIKNLQVFVTALQGSNEQIVHFQNRFATLTSVLNDNRSDLDAALSSLSVAIGEVQRFVAGTRDKTAEQVRRLGDVTSNLVKNRMVLEQVLHSAPTGLANYNNIYNPEQGSEAGSFVFNNFSNPITLICAGIASLKNVTSEEGAKLCQQYLGPVLKYLSLNYLPFPINPVLGPVPRPGKMYYTEPDLMPGVVSDVPPPPQPASTADMLLPGQQGGTP